MLGEGADAAVRACARPALRSALGPGLRPSRTTRDGAAERVSASWPFAILGIFSSLPSARMTASIGVPLTAQLRPEAGCRTPLPMCSRPRPRRGAPALLLAAGHPPGEACAADGADPAP